MKSLITNSENWLHPLALLSFSGATIVFLSPYIGLTTRWVFTFFLSFYLFIQFRFIGLFSIAFSKLVLLNTIWIACTVIWSQLPMLSFMKLSAHILVLFTFYYASQAWIMRHYINQALDFFWLSVFFSILAAIFGLGVSRSVVGSGVSSLYQGMVHGPNMLGALLLMSIPLLVWKIYYLWRNKFQCFFWICLLVIVFLFLLMANSRASIVGSLFCVVSLIYTLESRKWIPIVTTFVLLITTILIIYPTILDSAVNKYIYKNAAQELGVFHTRKSPWEVSVEQAKLGGWFGGGHGVTIGDYNFQGGMSTGGYGREKGNTPLAIVEELGLVGLMLYILVLASLYRHLLRAYHRCKHVKLKVLLGILIGAISGMIFHSMFEAWWVAPGSPEYVYFWTLVGAGIGVSRLIELDLMDRSKKQDEISQ